MRRLSLFFAMVTLSVCSWAQFDVPFEWKVSTEDKVLHITLSIPAHHYVYKNSTSIEVKDASGKVIEPLKTPSSQEYKDEFEGLTQIYPAPSAVWLYKYDPAAKPYSITIKSQGCRKAVDGESAICFMPQKLNLSTDSASPTPTRSTATTEAGTSGGQAISEFTTLSESFTVVSSKSGMTPAEEFKSFLKGESAGAGDFFENKSFVMIILLIIAGGLALNLTPCVLPMLPINLAIIGAGVKAESKLSGFYRGGIYGLGMAIAYGLLGVVVIRTGGQFGTLNSTAWFNFTIAAIFIILGLAMFDVFTIDFSRFGAKFNSRNMDRGRVASVFIMGAVMALLAGACVAPVVIAVIIYAGRLYNEGNVSAQFLPLLLGVGMALPWPLAGAGMSVMPKPGKWMMKVKYVFGVFIIIVALYYAYTAYTLLPLNGKGGGENNMELLNAGLKRAKTSGKPVLIDFWATWCKNCLHMKATTLKDPEVLEELKNFEFIEFQAEDFDDSATLAVLKKYGVQGLPTFVILEQKK